MKCPKCHKGRMLFLKAEDGATIFYCSEMSCDWQNGDYTDSCTIEEVSSKLHSEELRKNKHEH